MQVQDTALLYITGGDNDDDGDLLADKVHGAVIIVIVPACDVEQSRVLHLDQSQISIQYCINQSQVSIVIAHLQVVGNYDQHLVPPLGPAHCIGMKEVRYLRPHASQGFLCVAGAHVVAPKSPPVVLWFVIGCYPNSRLAMDQ